MEGAAVAADVTRSEQGTATVEGGGASRAETKAEEAVINPQLVGSIRGGLGLQQGAVAAPPGTATMDDAEKKRLKNKLKREKQKAKKKAAATAQGGASEAAPEPNAAGASADVQLTDAARKKQEANRKKRERQKAKKAAGDGSNWCARAQAALGACGRSRCTGCPGEVTMQLCLLVIVAWRRVEQRIAQLKEERPQTDAANEPHAVYPYKDWLATSNGWSGNLRPHYVAPQRKVTDAEIQVHARPTPAKAWYRTMLL
jgi:hypothetical protein